VSEEIPRIFPVGDHRGRPPEDTLLAVDDGAGEDVFDVNEKRNGKHQRAEFMKEQDGAEAAHASRKFASPETLAEAHGQPGGSETEKRAEQHRMQVTLRACEALEVPLLGHAGAHTGLSWLNLIRHLYVLHWRDFSPGCIAAGSATGWCESRRR